MWIVWIFGGSWIARVARRALAYTGVISYGLYLLHQPVRVLVQRLVPGLGAGVPVPAAAVTFVVAALSWELYEKRFVRYGHRFLYDPGEPARPAVPAVRPLGLRRYTRVPNPSGTLVPIERKDV